MFFSIIPIYSEKWCFPFSFPLSMPEARRVQSHKPRVVRSIKALRQLVNSLVDTLKSLFWALVWLRCTAADEVGLRVCTTHAGSGCAVRCGISTCHRGDSWVKVSPATYCKVDYIQSKANAFSQQTIGITSRSR